MAGIGEAFGVLRLDAAFPAAGFADYRRAWISMINAGY
jgi:hypothetical protein